MKKLSCVAYFVLLYCNFVSNDMPFFSYGRWCEYLYEWSGWSSNGRDWNNDCWAKMVLDYTLLRLQSHLTYVVFLFFILLRYVLAHLEKCPLEKFTPLWLCLLYLDSLWKKELIVNQSDLESCKWIIQYGGRDAHVFLVLCVKDCTECLFDLYDHDSYLLSSWTMIF